MMQRVWDELASWLWTLYKNPLLPRIRFLVALSMLVPFLWFILDYYKYRSRKRSVRFLIPILNAAVGHIVTYTLGLLQLVPPTAGSYELFNVWAVLVVVIMGRVGSATNFKDRKNRRKKEIADLLNSLFLANLMAKGGPNRFAKPLWLLWGLNLFRTLHDMLRAFQVVDLGLKDIHTNFSEYELREKRLPSSSTLTDLCPCGKNRLMEIRISFGLYDRLRRRLECSYKDELDGERKKHKERVTHLLREEKDPEIIFRIIRSELGFLNEHLHSRLPIVFGYGSPFIYFFYPIPLGAAAGWLAIQLLDYSHWNLFVFHEFDVLLTFVLTISLIFKEFGETFMYMFSDWNKIFLLITSADKTWLFGKVPEMLIGFWCKVTDILYCGDKIGQYHFFNSYTYRVRLRNVLFYASLGDINRVEEGAKTQSAAKLTKKAKEALVAPLRRILDSSADAHHCLMGGLAAPALEANVVGVLNWACDFENLARTLLVWHLATLLCEIHLFEKFPSLVPKTWKLFGCITIPCYIRLGCITIPYYTSTRNESLPSGFEVATSLSQCCAYMLVSTPEVLPDQSISPESIFKKTVVEARTILRGCKNREQICKVLMDMHESRETSRRESSPIIDGTRLAYELIYKNGSEDVDLKHIWKPLKEFWVNFILHLASSKKVEAHYTNPNKGGELITQLSALLYHFGISHSKETSGRCMINQIFPSTP